MTADRPEGAQPLALGRQIYCCGCGAEVQGRLTDGREIYPHRRDLADLPFWRCDACGNHVGCHHRHHDPEKRKEPLGNIPTPEIRNARQHIHALLDPLWKNGSLRRRQVYARLTRALGRQYHTGEIRTIEEAREVYRAVQVIATGRVPLPLHPIAPRRGDG